MPTIWCAISSHGYGHAAQVVPVLNELGRLVPRLIAILRTTVPASFFQDRLTVDWELQPVQQDVGCVQNGPLDIDVPATWQRHLEFHANWAQRLAQEVAAMDAAGPAVILADTPYLAISAGRQAGIPTVLLANFIWHEILAPFSRPEHSAHHTLLESMRQCYAHTNLALRIAPGLPLEASPKTLDIGPIAAPSTSQREQLRSHLKLAPSDQMVLLAFGGIPLVSLPWNHMARMEGHHFIVQETPPQPSLRIHSLSSLPVSFKTLLASVDVIMTKPGYGTIVEAVALRQPVLYVRRYNFADEPPLVSFLHRYGRGHELPLEDFLAGRWLPGLETVLHIKAPAVLPLISGPIEAARTLAQYLQ